MGPLLQTEGLILCMKGGAQRDAFCIFPQYSPLHQEKRTTKNLMNLQMNSFLCNVCMVPLAATQHAIDWGGENGFVYGNGF